MEIKRYEQEIHQGLHSWAEEHAEANPDIFVTLDIDPVKYPYQAVGVRKVTGNPISPDDIDKIAFDLDVRYGGISRSISSDGRGLKRIGELLNDNNNVVLATGHSEIRDIGLIMASLRSELVKRNYEFDTGIIVNAMVKYLGVKVGDNVLPALDVLGLAADETYVNIPNTNSAKDKIPIPRRVISFHNHAMVEYDINGRFKNTIKKDQRPMLLAVAMSGTVIKPLDVEKYESKLIAGADHIPYISEVFRHKTMVSGEVGHGILRIMKNAITVPSVSNLRRSNISVDLSDSPVAVRSREQLDAVLETINKMEAKSDPEHNYVYDRYGNLPVKRPRKNT